MTPDDYVRDTIATTGGRTVPIVIPPDGPARNTTRLELLLYAAIDESRARATRLEDSVRAFIAAPGLTSGTAAQRQAELVRLRADAQTVLGETTSSRARDLLRAEVVSVLKARLGDDAVMLPDGRVAIPLAALKRAMDGLARDPRPDVRVDVVHEPCE